MEKFKDYLGDSVYAEHDGYHIILTTDNGFGASNTIALEPEVYEALTRYVRRVKQIQEQEAKKEENKNG